MALHPLSSLTPTLSLALLTNESNGQVNNESKEEDKSLLIVFKEVSTPARLIQDLSQNRDTVVGTHVSDFYRR